MTPQIYQQIINEGIMGLPSDALAEYLSINKELHQMSRDEEAHLEKEFENYDKLYPRR